MFHSNSLNFWGFSLELWGFTHKLHWNFMVFHFGTLTNIFFHLFILCWFIERYRNVMILIRIIIKKILGHIGYSKETAHIFLFIQPSICHTILVRFTHLKHWNAFRSNIWLISWLISQILRWQTTKKLWRKQMVFKSARISLVEHDRKNGAENEWKLWPTPSSNRYSQFWHFSLTQLSGIFFRWMCMV